MVVLLSADTEAPHVFTHCCCRHWRGQRLGVRPPLFGPSHQVLRVPVLPGLIGPILQTAAESVSQSGNVNSLSLTHKHRPFPGGSNARSVLKSQETAALLSLAKSKLQQTASRCCCFCCCCQLQVSTLVPADAAAQSRHTNTDTARFDRSARFRVASARGRGLPWCC